MGDIQTHLPLISNALSVTDGIRPPIVLGLSLVWNFHEQTILRVFH